MMRHALTGLCLGILTAVAQNGDKPGETQREVVPADRIPPAPVLAPAEQIRSFRLPPGFTVELVAAEPLVHSPVAIQFDPQGRLWVVEMTGYMPNVEAKGEAEPTGTIAILSDTDADGRMDTRTVFADRLVMPRALHLTHGGALVAEPPRLWWMKDTDGDGKADQKLLVATDYATQNDPALGLKSNPEHASNGLLLNLDNWIYSANHTVRFRNAAGSPPSWIREDTVTRGQWGITHDDVGRLVYNSNSDQIRGDLVPAHYLLRNPNLKSAFGVNAQWAKSQQVWPSRVNPGVNRGYQPNTLTAEGRLASFTAACGPLVYRGDQFPEEFRGDVFLCEPSANLIRRNKLTEDDGVITAANAYASDEFLTSTDERFRPVNLQNGPDGALYVVDMARGLIQHRIYLTSYLRKQIESRTLQAPTDLGRIYRVVHSGKLPDRRARMPEKPSTRDLVTRLSSPNGYWRDTAQRLLVEAPSAEAVEALQHLVQQRETTPALARLHALWTLEGQGKVGLESLLAALDDPDSRVRSASFRIAESLPPGPVREAALERMIQRATSVRPAEQIALLCALGNVGTPAADAAMRFVLMTGPSTPLRQDAAISGLKGRELAFLNSLLTDAQCGPDKQEHAPLVSKLARCVGTSRHPADIAATLDLAARLKDTDWPAAAILDGFTGLIPVASKGAPAPKIQQVALAAEPAGLAKLRQSPQAGITDRIRRIESLYYWPGKAANADTVAAANVQALPPAAKASFDRGREIYTTICGACHQPHGNGQEGLAPPLVDSEWVLGSEKRLVRLVLHGLRDAITVKGVRYELNMPALAEALDDTQIADSLTYIRREWGHAGSPVSAEVVKAIRAEESKREDSWTQAELEKIP
jgi:mono/diheme cytochrome c family protein/glucose/arabinose dehydrogenase